MRPPTASDLSSDDILLLAASQKTFLCKKRQNEGPEITFGNLFYQRTCHQKVQPAFNLVWVFLPKKSMKPLISATLRQFHQP